MRRTCTEEGCDRPINGRGLCSRHYQLAVYHGTLPTEMPVRSCAFCGETFQARKWNASYCSKRCNDRARFERTRRIPRRQEACDQCGGSLADKRRDARFCSDGCAQGWRNAQTAEATLRSKADRPLCLGCGESVPPERKVNALYCSDRCKRDAKRCESYGISLPEFRALLAAQGGGCGICGTDQWGRRGPQIDHCHETGPVRGVLCINCNNGLGRFKDNLSYLRAAINYLEAHASV